MSTVVTNEDLTQALDRIARTPDGVMLYLYLQKTLCGVTAPELSDGVLRRFEGKRSFAAELMALMSKGISLSDRSGPITFAVAQRSAPRARVPGARLVSADQPVAGYDASSDDDRPGPGR